jgi:hypothetical protein
MTKKKDPSQLKIRPIDSNAPMTCTGVCGRTLEVTEKNFYFRKAKNGKKYPGKECIDCGRAKSAASRKARWANPEERQIISYQNKYWRDSNPLYLERKRKKYLVKYSSDPAFRAKLRKSARDWGKKNLLRKSKNNAAWHQRTKARNNRKKNLFAIFYPDLRFRGVLRSAINESIRLSGGNKNGRSIPQFLPYTMEELRIHLESLWDPWMSWENYGPIDHSRRTWQIDHIISQSDLPYDDFSHPNFLICWSLSNLRPLDSKRNASEGRRDYEKEDNQ